MRFIQAIVEIGSLYFVFFLLQIYKLPKLVTRPKAEAESLLRRMNRKSQLMIEILLFHQPVRPECQTNRGKRWLRILFFFSSVSSESVFFAYDTTIFTTRRLRSCAYYLVFHFCQSIPRKQAGSLVPCAL